MPLPSGPTAAGLVSPERLGRWRREAGAEAAALAAAARSACALASSSEAQARPLLGTRLLRLFGWCLELGAEWAAGQAGAAAAALTAAVQRATRAGQLPELPWGQGSCVLWLLLLTDCSWRDGRGGSALIPAFDRPAGASGAVVRGGRGARRVAQHARGGGRD